MTFSNVWRSATSMSLYDEYPGGVRLSADEIHVYVVGLGGLRLVRARADEDERHRRKTHGRKRGNHCNTFFHTILPVSRVFSEFSADRQPVVYGVPSLPILTGKRTSVIPDPRTAIPADGGFPLFPTTQYTTGWAALSTRILLHFLKNIPVLCPRQSVCRKRRRKERAPDFMRRRRRHRAGSGSDGRRADGRGGIQGRGGQIVRFVHKIVRFWY